LSLNCNFKDWFNIKLVIFCYKDIVFSDQFVYVLYSQTLNNFFFHFLKNKLTITHSHGLGFAFEFVQFSNEFIYSINQICLYDF